jgi:hypothetical protein
LVRLSSSGRSVRLVIGSRPTWYSRATTSFWVRGEQQEVHQLGEPGAGEAVVAGGVGLVGVASSAVRWTALLALVERAMGRNSLDTSARVADDEAEVDLEEA